MACEGAAHCGACEQTRLHALTPLHRHADLWYIICHESLIGIASSGVHELLVFSATSFFS